MHNSQLSIMKRAMNLGPIGNLQGGYKCTSLSSRKKVNQRSWDAIPISDEVITRVNVNRINQQEQLIFMDWRRQPIGDVGVSRMDEQNEDLQIPGVNANQVDNINLPGVDGKQNESPQTKITDANNDVIDIDDLDIAQPEPNVTEQDPLREVETEPITGVETTEEPMELIEYPTVPAQVIQEPAAGTGEISVSF